MHNTVDAQWEDGVVWHLEEDLRIGTPEGDGSFRFGVIRDLAVGPEGRIFVLDDTTQIVGVFDHEGAFSHSFGVWEEREANDLEFDGEGRLWVRHGLPTQAYTVHTPQGDRLRTIPREVEGSFFPWKVRFTGDEHFYAWGIEADGLQGPHRYVPLRVSAVDGSILERGEPLIQRFPRSRHGRLLPYSPRHRSAPADAGALWHAISDEYTIFHRTFDGRITRAFSLDRPPPPVTQAERDSIMEWHFENWSAEDGRLEPDEIPETGHVVDRIRLDEEGGYLYVFTTPASGVPVIDVFTTGGDFLGTLDLPHPILRYPAPHVTRDHLYVATRDADGTTWISRWRVVRTSGG